MNLQASRLPAKLELCVPLGVSNVRHRAGNYLISHLTFHKKYGSCEAVVAAATQKQKEKVIYARVSSPAQRGDLQRQSEDLHAKHPTHVLVTDIAFCINFQRRWLKTILDRAHNGTLDELVVAQKDRLCRFAFNLVRDVLARSGCKLVVLGQANGPDG